MSKRNAEYRQSLKSRNKNRIQCGKDIVLFRYGVLGSRSWAKGYCLYHNCFISTRDLKEKHCNKKCCSHFMKKNIEQFG